MEWLIFIGVFLVPIGVASVGVWLHPGKRAWIHLVLSPVPLVLLVRLAYIVLFTERPDPSTLELASPFVLVVVTYVYMWARAYQKDPKGTMSVTAAAGYTMMGVAAARKYQKMRDQERAKALADELQRRGEER